MSRTRQKLINFHSSGNTNVPLEDLNYGEIAVRHRTNPGESQLIIKTSENTSAVFVESAGVVNMISEGVAGVTTNVTELAKSLSAVSATAVSTAAELAQHIIDNGSFFAEIRNDLSAAVVSDISNLATNYYDKDDIDGKFSEVNTNTGNLQTNLTQLSGVVSSFTANVSSNFTTHEEASGIRDTAITSARNYTNEVSGYIATTLANEYWTTAVTNQKLETINGNTGRIDTNLTQLSGAVSSFTATVVSNYTTHTEASGIRDTAITSARTYTKEVSGHIATTLANEYWTTAVTNQKLETINGNTGRIDTNLTQLSGAVSALSESVVSMEDRLIDTIESALTVVYKFKGTKTSVQDLLDVQNPSNGDVYNLTVASGNTPPGTNYAWNEETNTWDALGGTVDLSEYITTTQYNQLVANTGRLDTDLTQLSGVVSSFTANVSSNFTTHEEASGIRDTAITSAINYTNEVSGYIATTLANEYWTTAVTNQKLETINGNTGRIDTNLTQLSGAVSSFTATVVNNYTTHTEASGIRDTAITSARTYTKEVSGHIATTLANEYWTSAVTNEKLETIKSDTGQLSTDLTTLKGRVDTIEPIAESALQGFELTGSGTTTSGTQTLQSGAKANYTTGGVATLDLSEFVIDCGDW